MSYGKHLGSRGCTGTVDQPCHKPLPELSGSEGRQIWTYWKNIRITVHNNNGNNNNATHLQGGRPALEARFILMAFRKRIMMMI
ncbi:hypothetical protein N9L68_06190 [bacterium]|nr:hypothetical protein [bacterium]